ncbi:hybrid sensor histidine kinase/response regulator [Candidatus Fermentibacteria bacterium]|nr:MAG: hybrid sensor histidine kinase/response regulator [Candidatus Fermentibacteria bacterium]
MDMDKNERILAEQALRDSEERYRTFVEASMDAIYLESIEGEILDCNEAACEMLGYRKDELIGKSVTDLLPKNKRYLLPEIVDKLMSDGESFIEGENLRKDGTTVPVESRARVIDTPAGKRVVVYVRDISRWKQSEKELIESEKRFRSFMDQLPGAVFLKDSDSRYIYINQFMRKAFNADESWIGKLTSECFPMEEAHSLIRHDRDAFDKNYIIDVQKVVDSGGKERIFQIHKFRISKGESENDMLGGVGLDVTDQLNAEKARVKLEAQIQHTQKLESLGVLAGGIAHDFNNILMAILGYADLALLDTSAGSPVVPSLHEIEKATRNAADLTKQMLAYSGKGTFQIIKLDLNEIIREMTHLLDISISKNAVIKYDLYDGLPTIEADPSQIRQIIMNLVTNASDAMDKTSGVISITTNHMECDSEYLSAAFMNDQLPDGKYVYLEVSDTGNGMDEETLSKLFDPFFTTKSTGRGLGLSAVLGIIRGHRGTVKVYSELGKGTSFKILIPSVEGEPEQTAVSDESEHDVIQKGTLLLVDDESSIRDIGQTMLEKTGYTVITSSDGREALGIFRERHEEIDCVILDLTMPHMDGEETFREMRRIQSDVCVIISSGYNRQDVTRRFTGKGLAGFIQKPYRLSELTAKLKEVID